MYQYILFNLKSFIIHYIMSCEKWSLPKIVLKWKGKRNRQIFFDIFPSHLIRTREAGMHSWKCLYYGSSIERIYRTLSILILLMSFLYQRKIGVGVWQSGRIFPFASHWNVMKLPRKRWCNFTILYKITSPLNVMWGPSSVLLIIWDNSS